MRCARATLIIQTEQNGTELNIIDSGFLYGDTTTEQ